VAECLARARAAGLSLAAAAGLYRDKLIDCREGGRGGSATRTNGSGVRFFKPPGGCCTNLLVTGEGDAERMADG
jgi:hypothetical protein